MNEYERFFIELFNRGFIIDRRFKNPLLKRLENENGFIFDRKLLNETRKRKMQRFLESEKAPEKIAPALRVDLDEILPRSLERQPDFPFIWENVPENCYLYFK